MTSRTDVHTLTRPSHKVTLALNHQQQQSPCSAAIFSSILFDADARHSIRRCYILVLDDTKTALHQTISIPIQNLHLMRPKCHLQATIPLNSLPTSKAPTTHYPSTPQSTSTSTLCTSTQNFAIRHAAPARASHCRCPLQMPTAARCATRQITGLYQPRSPLPLYQYTIAPIPNFRPVLYLAGSALVGVIAA